MGHTIQVGDHYLRMDRDYDINTRQVLVSFMDESIRPRRGCIWSVPIDDDRNGKLMEDDWYVEQAIAIMEKAGGFDRVAQEHLPGEMMHLSNLKHEYDKGCRDGFHAMKCEIIMRMRNLSHSDTAELHRIADAAQAKLKAELE